MNYEAMIWSGVWGLFTSIVITPALNLEPAAGILVVVLGALVITATFKR